MPDADPAPVLADLLGILYHHVRASSSTPCPRALAGLADLASDLLVTIANPLALVRLGRSHPPDLRRHLPNPLLVYTTHDDRCRVRHLEVYAFALRDGNRM